MRKEHRTAIVVALLTLAAIVFVTFFRNGTAW
jgi:hypothetical protein